MAESVVGSPVRRAALLALLLLSSRCGRAFRATPVQGPGTVSLPASDLGRAADAWLKVYNFGSADSSRIFAGQAFTPAALARRPPAVRAAAEQWLYERTGPIEPFALENVTDTSLTLIVRLTRFGGWGRARVVTTSAVPRKIASASFLSLFDQPPADSYIAGRLTDDSIARGVEELASRLNRADLFAGVVYITHRRRVVLAHAYGMADIAGGRANTVETPFELASVAKMFTAVAIGQLAQARRMAFSDTVGSLIPDFPGQSTLRRITVHQLLTHTSGLPDYLGDERYLASKQAGQIRTLRDVWIIMSKDSLEFLPGKGNEYSNANYLLLGAILEQLSGAGFADVLRDHIFTVAGLSHTWETALPMTPRAIGYHGAAPGTAGGWTAMPLAPSIGGPAGGGSATAPDLVRFGEAVLGHRLLSPMMTDTLFASRVSTDDGGSATYGFDGQRWNGVRFVGHSGGFPGTSNEVDLYPDDGYVVVILGNYDGMGTLALMQAVRELLTRR